MKVNGDYRWFKAFEAGWNAAPNPGPQRDAYRAFEQWSAAENIRHEAERQRHLADSESRRRAAHVSDEAMRSRRVIDLARALQIETHEAFRLVHVMSVHGTAADLWRNDDDEPIGRVTLTYDRHLVDFAA